MVNLTDNLTPHEVAKRYLRGLYSLDDLLEYTFALLENGKLPPDRAGTFYYGLKNGTFELKDGKVVYKGA